MKYLYILASLGVFTLNDATLVIGNVNNAKQYLQRAIKANIIRRVKQDLYVAINISTGSDMANKYQIACKINDGCFISYHSAFEFYACYNQVFNELQVSSNKRFTEFNDENITYCYFHSNINKQVEIINGIKVTSIERTIVDSINMLGKVMDFEELIKCIEDVESIDEKKIIEMLEEYNKDILYCKVGYILSIYKDYFKLSDDFIELCLEHTNSNSYGSISSREMGKLKYIPKWKLYGYEDIKKVVDKGNKYDV